MTIQLCRMKFGKYWIFYLKNLIKCFPKFPWENLVKLRGKSR